MSITRIESNRNRHFGLKIESKSIENRNLEIVTSLWMLIGHTEDSLVACDMSLCPTLKITFRFSLQQCLIENSLSKACISADTVTLFYPFIVELRFV